MLAARFESPHTLYDYFLGDRARVALAPTLEGELREALAQLQVTHGADPRNRTKEELDALPVGTKLSYYGQGESFTSVKQPNGTWRSEVYEGYPLMKTCLVR